MTPEELRLLVQEVIRQGVHFPWWSYFFAFVMSIAGTYLAAYIGAKAQSRATIENFESLRNQLRKNTQETEEIKAMFSHFAWLNQQQWNLRERYYMNLLEHLGKLKISLEDRASYYDGPEPWNYEAPRENKHYQSLVTVGCNAIRAIRELIGPSSVFLSPESVKELEELVRQYDRASEQAMCSADFVFDACKCTKKAYRNIILAAQAELKQPTL